MGTAHGLFFFFFNHVTLSLSLFLLPPETSTIGLGGRVTEGEGVERHIQRKGEREREGGID